MNYEEQEYYEEIERLAVIEARKVAWQQNPYLFVFWDITMRALSVAFWLGFWYIVLWS